MCNDTLQGESFNSNSNKEYYERFIDLLKQENELVDKYISRQGNRLLEIKKWIMAAWTGILFIIFKVKLGPISFGGLLLILIGGWIIEAVFRSTQYKFVYRSIKIGELINEEGVLECTDMGIQKLKKFKLNDPKARGYKNDPKYKKEVSFFNNFRAPSICVFYFVFIVVTFLMSFIYVLNPSQVNSKAISAGNTCKVVFTSDCPLTKVDQRSQQSLKQAP